MARNLDKCRHCRREGEKLFLKGEKCFTDKCPVERRAYAPGQHGQKSGARLSDSGEQLLQLLESRLDTVTFRMGFGASRAEARQVVRHNGILVNGKRVNIPSYEVRPGDVVEVAPKQKEQLRIKAAAENTSSRGLPDWMEVDAKALKGTFKQLPQRAELSSTINESLIIELYSK